MAKKNTISNTTNENKKNFLFSFKNFIKQHPVATAATIVGLTVATVFTAGAILLIPATVLPILAGIGVVGGMIAAYGMIKETREHWASALSVMGAGLACGLFPIIGIPVGLALLGSLVTAGCAGLAVVITKRFCKEDNNSSKKAPRHGNDDVQSPAPSSSTSSAPLLQASVNQKSSQRQEEEQPHNNAAKNSSSPSDARRFSFYAPKTPTSETPNSAPSSALEADAARNTMM